MAVPLTEKKKGDIEKCNWGRDHTTSSVYFLLHPLHSRLAIYGSEKYLTFQDSIYPVPQKRKKHALVCA